MQTKWMESNFNYDGSQLKSLFAYLNLGVLGDSVVAGVGSCDIPRSHMVDGEDLRVNAIIRGGNMVHFIIEKFAVDLFGAVAIQRVCASLVIDLLRAESPNKDLALHLHRDGDDVYVGERKLSISIATLSPVSCVVHFAVNVTNENTPVPTISLNDFGIDAKVFGQNLMKRLALEIESMETATRKVRPVGSH